jgi:LacI family transcriptional regulator
MEIEHAWVDYDNARYAEIAVARLAARGRRNLALLPPPANLTYARHMTEGFVRGIELHDLTEVPVHRVTIDSPPAEVQTEVARLMATRRRPDGLVCASAAAAISAIAAAESVGLTIGRDFDVAVKESFDLMRKFRREIIVLHEDFRAAGVALARAVVKTIEGAPAAELQRLEVPDDPVPTAAAPG